MGINIVLEKGCILNEEIFGAIIRRQFGPSNYLQKDMLSKNILFQN